MSSNSEQVKALKAELKALEGHVQKSGKETRDETVAARVQARSAPAPANAADKKAHRKAAVEAEMDAEKVKKEQVMAKRAEIRALQKAQ